MYTDVYIIYDTRYPLESECILLLLVVLGNLTHSMAHVDGWSSCQVLGGRGEVEWESASVYSTSNWVGG